MRRVPAMRRALASGALALMLLAGHVAALQTHQPHQDAAIRDTVAAVFRQPAYARSIRETLWDRFWTWLGTQLQHLTSAAGRTPLLRRIALGVLGLILLAIVARIAVLAYARRGQSAALRGERTRARRAGREDPWALAQSEAAAGNYTEAAHSLYRALLDAIARTDRVRLHPSKTVGDYVRELRARSSSTFARFRDFARSYEVVVYGLGRCDRERYERLHALALPIVHRDG